MKKIILFLIILSAILISGEFVSFYRVENASEKFTRPLPKGAVIYDKLGKQFFQLLAYADTSKSISSSSVVSADSGFASNYEIAISDSGKNVTSIIFINGARMSNDDPDTLRIKEDNIKFEGNSITADNIIAYEELSVFSKMTLFDSLTFVSTLENSIWYHIDDIPPYDEFMGFKAPLFNWYGLTNFNDEVLFLDTLCFAVGGSKLKGNGSYLDAYCDEFTIFNEGGSDYSYLLCKGFESEYVNTDSVKTQILNVTGGIITNLTSVNTSSYLLTKQNYDLSIIYTITGAVTITLPTQLDLTGRTFIISDDGGNSSINNITIQDDAGTPNILFIISGNNDSYKIIYNGTNWVRR